MGTTRSEDSLNRQLFEKLLLGTERDGMDRLVAYLRQSDFYTAPASTRYHGAYPGGLLNHSINVYEILDKKIKGEGMWQGLDSVPGDSIIIIGLLHDICKTNYYGTEMRNRKVNGKWEQVPYYTVADTMPYGHGEKSVMMAEQFTKLTQMERFAIRWHMGPYSGERDWNTLSEAFKMYPICLATFEADMEATYLAEKGEE